VVPVPAHRERIAKPARGISQSSHVELGCSGHVKKICVRASQIVDCLCIHYTYTSLDYGVHYKGGEGGREREREKERKKEREKERERERSVQ
jgi:hypothetical protein